MISRTSGAVERKLTLIDLSRLYSWVTGVNVSMRKCLGYTFLALGQ